MQPLVFGVWVPGQKPARSVGRKSKRHRARPSVRLHLPVAEGDRVLPPQQRDPQRHQARKLADQPQVSAPPSLFGQLNWAFVAVCIETTSLRSVTSDSHGKSISQAPSCPTTLRLGGTEHLNCCSVITTAKKSISGQLAASWEKLLMETLCSLASQKLTSSSASRKFLANWRPTSKSYSTKIHVSSDCSSHPNQSQRHWNVDIWAKWRLKRFSASKGCCPLTRKSVSQLLMLWLSPGSTTCVSQILTS